MTHSVAATSNAAVAPETVTARPARTTGTSFAAAHAAAVNASTGTDATTAASGSSSSPSSSSSASSDAPKGERTQKVAGHGYVEIVSGPRNGMFINNTGGKRDGEAFLIVKRHGREFHIYGTGEGRAVYEVGRKREDTAAPSTSGTTAPAATSGTSTTGTAGSTGSTGTTAASGAGTTGAQTTAAPTG
jgi:hypothetical protein